MANANQDFGRNDVRKAVEEAMAAIGTALSNVWKAGATGMLDKSTAAKREDAEHLQVNLGEVVRTIDKAEAPKVAKEAIPKNTQL